MNYVTTKLVLPTNYKVISEDEARLIIGGVRLLYLRKEDINGMLITAAIAGPTVMGEVLTGFMTMVGGPAGAAAGTILGILGAGGLANICYLLIQAYNTDKGFYMDLNMNGIFPNISMGVE